MKRAGMRVIFVSTVRKSRCKWKLIETFGITCTDLQGEHEFPFASGEDHRSARTPRQKSNSAGELGRPKVRDLWPGRWTNPYASKRTQNRAASRNHENPAVRSRRSTVGNRPSTRRNGLRRRHGCSECG